MKNRVIAFIFFLLLVSIEGISQTIIRGPYLQLNTQNSIILRWRTDVSTDSKVWYGDTPENLTLTQTLIGSRTEHEIQITGLNPNTTYYYAVGNGSGQLAGADRDHFFETSPVPGSNHSFDAWVLGDAGTADGKQRAVRDGFYSYNGGPHADLILLLGDNAYDYGLDTEYQYAWFEDMYEPSLINSPLWPIPGNHDVATSHGVAVSATETGPYYDIFNLPRNGEAGGVPSGTEAWYSYDYANVHFVCLNSEDVDLSTTGPMLTWLVNDLANTNQDWIVAYFHQSPYYSQTEARTQFLPILEEYGVDIVFYGHQHYYKRSFLINGNYGSVGTFDEVTMTNQLGDGHLDGDGPYAKSEVRAPRDGTIYVLSGSAGSGPGADDPNPFQPYYRDSNGSVKLSVSGGRLDAKFIDNLGVVLDYFTMTKGPNPSVIVSYPLNGASFPEPQTVNITADALDPDGTVNLVEFFVDGISIGTDNAAPYEISWTPSEEKYYELHAVVDDNDGNQTVSSKVKILMGPPTSGTLAFPVNISENDVEERVSTGFVGLGGSDIELGNDLGVDQVIGLRYENINLSPDYNIQEAYIQFTADEVSTGPSSLFIEGEATDNAPPFSSIAYNVSNRSRTSANATWNPPDWTSVGAANSAQRTTDISGIIREIINRPGWVAGNSMVFIITGTGTRTAEAYDGTTPAAAAKLYIHYDNTPTCTEVGQTCDDGDDCTENDVINANCNCVGTLIDSDNDGVCDTDDVCPGFDDFADADNDNIPDGCDVCPTSADHGDDDLDGIVNGCDPCPTSADHTDTDGDGIPDACDTCDDTLIGTTCDDGDPNTDNDVIGEGCICAGTPNTPSAFAVSITTGNDDVEEEVITGAIGTSSSDLELAYEGTTAQIIGLRFLNINIPKDANIQNAYIQFTVDEITGNDISLLIEGEATDNAPAFTATAFNVSSRSRTSANAAWSPPAWPVVGAAGVDQQTTDISGIISEIVSRPGWVAGNSIVLIISGTGRRTAESYNGSAAQAPRLNIEYYEAAPCPTVGQTCDDGDDCTENDVIDANCNCVGTLIDSDNDGVCDTDDVCPGFDDLADADNDNIPDGCDVCPTSADHGDDDLDGIVNGCDPCPTSADHTDTDGDGIPDACDTCDDTLIGTTCDDGDPNTVNDVIGEGCICAGTPNTPNAFAVSIAAGIDDVEEEVITGAIGTSSSDLELAYEGTTAQIIGLRFLNINIPKDANVQNAYIQFTVDEITGNDISLLIEGEATDNAPAFTTTAFNVSSRSRTSANATWSPPAWSVVGAAGVDQQTTDISGIISEIVSRPGWVEGNSIVLIISGTGTRTAESYDSGAAQAPRLYIEYYEAAPCPTVGQACNDGDDCTENDVIDANCNCVGTLIDSDNDGVCDTDDVCPGFDDFADADNDNIPDGCDVCPTSADHGDDDLDGIVNGCDPCPTSADHTDTDGDGIPDACDTCDDTLIGTTCDDGDPNTVNDVIGEGCICAGTPNTPSAFAVSIATGDDDVEERISNNGAISTSSSDLELSTDGTREQIIGLRFLNITIPQGANVQNAYIQFTVDEITGNDISLLIEGEATDNAPAFTATAYNVSSRSRTSANAAWSPPAWSVVGAAGVDQQTTDISGIISEIVSRPGWVEGNSIVLIISGTGRRTAESYNGSAAQAPRLNIEYYEAAPCPTVGQACNDGDDCTENDVIDANCNCVGTLIDSDNDGVCDTDDVCPGFDDLADADNDNIPDGCDICPTSADHGDDDLDGIVNGCDPCPTSADHTDTDGDGIPDACDTCDDTLIGTTCDDGDPDTDNDVIGEGCICAGTPNTPNTFEVSIAAGDDDVEERISNNGAISTSSSDLELSTDGTREQIIGLRFLNITIPQDANIINAYIQFTVDEITGNDISLLIEGEAIDNAPPFTQTAYDVSSRSRTSANAAWSPPAWPVVGVAGADQQTTDISGIISEIVSRPGWVEGNSIVIIISGTGRRTAESYNGSVAGAARLHIEYYNAGGSTARMSDNPGDQASLEQDLFTNSKDLEIIIKPNPFQDNFSVYIESPFKDVEEAEIRIVNLSGKMVYQQSRVPLGEEYIIESYTGWPDGVYFIQIQSGEFYKTLKVIKE